ncbi:MAG: hypothetical protein ACOCRX_07975 [Candidatus Woesearchaeota archaeon]
MNETQKQLIDELYDVLLKIENEAFDDDQFYEWLSENYFFKYDLEDIIFQIKKAKKNIEKR